MEHVPEEDEEAASPDDPKLKISNWVALLVAVLATFMGICSVKAGNIAQEMEKQQSLVVDSWAWYQAKKIRLQFGEVTLDQFEIQALTAEGETARLIEEKAAKIEAKMEEQTAELAEIEAKAREAEARYEELNTHDDQFDLEEAFLAIAISMLALTALTQPRWLLAVAAAPMVGGVVMGLAGLCGWSVSLDIVSKLLGA